MNFNDYLTGPNGEQSSKRMFTLSLMVVWHVYIFANLFWGFTLSPLIAEQLFYMILFFYTGITLEGWKSVFSKNKPSEEKLPAPPTQSVTQ